MDPVAGIWIIVVHGWQTDGPDSNYTLFDFMVPAAPGGGSLSIDSAPGAATLGLTGTVIAKWAGLTVDTKYLGAVSHTNGGLIGLTTVAVDG